MSRRKEDMQAEQLLSSLMNIWVWEPLKGVGNIKSFSREKDKDKQLKGTDVWLETKSNKLISVDEKAQLYYINANLPTFAFELGFIGQGGQVKQGWFVNNNLDTNMYMLVWPYAKTTELSKLTYDSFIKLECILISKNVIWQELIRSGLTYDFLLEETTKMRESGQVGRKFFPGIEWCYLNMSDPKKYTETPINIIIKKDKLLELANQIFFATPDKLLLGKGEDKGTIIHHNLFLKRVSKI